MKPLKRIAFGLLLSAASSSMAADTGDRVNHNNMVWCDSCGKYIQQANMDDQTFVQAPISTTTDAPKDVKIGE